MNENKYTARSPDNREQNRHLPEIRQAQLILLRMFKVFDAICRDHGLVYWLDGGSALGAFRHQGFIPWDDDIDIGMPRKDFEKLKKILPQQLPGDMASQVSESDKHYYNNIVPLKIRDKLSHIVEPRDHAYNNPFQGLFLDIFPYDFMPKYNLAYYSIRTFIREVCDRPNMAKVAIKPSKRGFYFYKLLGCLIPVHIRLKLKKIILSKNKPSSQVMLGYDSGLTALTFDSDTFEPVKEMLFEDMMAFVPGKIEKYLGDKYGDYMEIPPKGFQKPFEHFKVITFCQPD